MNNLKEKLLSLGIFIDNKYLDFYCKLIEENIDTKKVSGLTERHHIIQKAYYKLNNLPIDHTVENLVNLTHHNHCLAHYYLCLCTVAELQYANQLALICLVSRKKLNSVDKQLVTTLPLYKNIYESYIKNRQNGMQLYKEDID